MTPIFAGLGPLKWATPKATAALLFSGARFAIPHLPLQVCREGRKEGSRTWAEEAVFANSTVLHGGQWLRIGLCFIWIKGGLGHSVSCGLYKFHGPL